MKVLTARRITNQRSLTPSILNSLTVYDSTPSKNVQVTIRDYPNDFVITYVNPSQDTVALSVSYKPVSASFPNDGTVQTQANAALTETSAGTGRYSKSLVGSVHPKACPSAVWLNS